MFAIFDFSLYKKAAFLCFPILLSLSHVLTNNAWADNSKVMHNHAPIAVDDAASTTKLQSVSIDVLNNDSDPDNDALTIIDYSTPLNGQLAFQNGTFTYTPNSNFTGVDSFTYSISDGSYIEARATATSTAIAAFFPGGNLTNTDTFTFSITDGQGGEAVSNADGTATIVSSTEDIPNNTETFTFTILNGIDGEAVVTATASAVVSSENTSAIATATAIAIHTPTINFTNSETFTFTLVKNSGEANATAEAIADIVFTPESNMFQYTIRDSSGQEVTATIIAIAVATVSASIRAMTIDTATVKINVHDPAVTNHNIPTLSGWMLIILTLSLIYLGSREITFKEK